MSSEDEKSDDYGKFFGFCYCLNSDLKSALETSKLWLIDLFSINLFESHGEDRTNYEI